MTLLSSLLCSFPRCAWLEKRKILSVRGSDALKFLQGLTTNDMNAVTTPRPRLLVLLVALLVYLFAFSADGNSS